MDRMVERDRRLDDDVHPLTHLGQVEHQVSRIGWRFVISKNADKSGVLVFGVEGVAVEIPFEKVLRVCAEGDVLCEGLVLVVCVDLGCWHQRRQGLIHALALVVVGLGFRQGTLVWSFSVTDYGLDVMGLVVGSARLLTVRSHPVVSRLLVCLHEDHVALTDLDVEDLSLIWDDVCEVHVDNLKLMIVDVKLHGPLHSRVDDAEQICLAWLESGVALVSLSRLVVRTVKSPSVHTVDKASVHCTRSSVDGILLHVIPVLVSFTARYETLYELTSHPLERESNPGGRAGQRQHHRTLMLGRG